jgi:hypothetical protein
VKAAFQRIFAATIFFGTKQETKKHTVVESDRFHFMDSMRLWFNGTAEAESPGDESPHKMIALSEAFYQEITAHPIPVEREVIAALAHAPGLMGFYIWIAWKAGLSMASPFRFQSSAQTASPTNWARLRTP